MADPIIDMTGPALRRAGFYVYVHRRATTGAVFYVGKGTDRRAWEAFNRNQHWRRIVQKHGYTVELVLRGAQEWYACEYERELIAYYGRDQLCNKTDGGEGVSGYKSTPERNEKIRRAATGRKHTPESRMKMSAAQRGHPGPTLEVRRRYSEEYKGRTLSPETRRKMADARRGRKHTEEAKRNMRAAFTAHATPVRCIETGRIFDRIRAAEDWLRSRGIKISTRCTISNCIAGRNITAHGYRWERVPKQSALPF